LRNERNKEEEEEEEEICAAAEDGVCNLTAPGHKAKFILLNHLQVKLIITRETPQR
jgi:hypothetical protein